MAVPTRMTAVATTLSSLTFIEPPTKQRQFYSLSTPCETYASLVAAVTHIDRPELGSCATTDLADALGPLEWLT